MKKLLLMPLFAAFFASSSFAQLNEIKENIANDPGHISGNFELGAQYYREDSAINAPIVPEKILANGFANVNYVRGNFRAGVRYESYENVLLGFDPNYQGSGIPYRYAGFTMNNLDITVGNFYEQFGSGQILRAYEERGLGLDNALDGVRVKYNPYKGIYLKGLVGRQRIFFSKGPGIVRGIDGEFLLNEIFESKFGESNLRITLGGSAVSKYEEDDNPTYVLPENVAAVSGRAQANYQGFSLYAEYSHKYNDPSADNNFIYKDGDILFLNGAYSTKGFGINLSAKTVDNMSFRSDRNEAINNLWINYLPALTRQHTYNLAATLYPYATQPLGEVAYQADITYKIPKGTLLGGKYGTSIAVNYSQAHNIDSTQIGDLATTRNGYKTNFGALGDNKYWHDFNLEVVHKFSKKFKLKGMYMNFQYDIDVIQGKTAKPDIFGDILVLEPIFKFNRKNSLRFELQALRTNQDQGDWATVLAEYSYSPHWIVSFMNQYNYGNSVAAQRLHYPYANVTYVNGANRIQLGYGRVREGIFCIGGVCRNMPASNGARITITSTF